MANTLRYEQNSLKNHLVEQICCYDFFQAVDLLQCINSGATPVGRAGPPSDEVLRFQPHTTFGFASSDLVGLTFPDQGEAPAQLHTTFMSLYGRHGTLPWHYTAQLKGEEKDFKKSSMREFLDLFNHRIISHFYCAGTKYRIPGMYRGSNGLYNTVLGSFLGVSTRHIGAASSIDIRRLYALGNLFQQAHSALGLKALLESYFSMPVTIKEFVGEWMPIDNEEWSTIGSGKRNNQLGRSFCMGRHSWSVQHKFMVKIGPLGYGEYCSMQPGTIRFQTLDELVQLYVGPSLTYSVHFQLLPATTPGFVLGMKQPLGRSLWMRTRSNQESLNHTFEFLRHTH